MSDTTTRWAIIEPAAARTDAADVPFYTRQISQALESIGVQYGQGTHSARPTAGIGGRWYYETDTLTMFWDNGSAWVNPAPASTIPSGTLASRPAAASGLNGTLYYATDQVTTYMCIAAAWVRVSEQPGKVSMTLAATASAGHILLQGQAWPSTTGIYADLYAQLTSPATVPQLGGFTPVGYKSADGSFGTLLATLGEKTHTLTLGEIQHDHDIPTNATGSGASNFAVQTTLPWTTGPAKDNTATGHNNIQPSIVVNFEAKL